LYPDLITGGEGVPEVDESLSGHSVFYGLPCSTWEEANLLPSLKYIRGNKHLSIPKEWLESFPEPLEILHRVEQRLLREQSGSSSG